MPWDKPRKHTVAYLKCSTSETEGHYTLNQASNIPGPPFLGLCLLGLCALVLGPGAVISEMISHRSSTC